MNRSLCRASGTLALTLLAAFAGCAGGPAATPVEGRLLNNGTAYAIDTKGLPPGDKGLRVYFVALDKEGKAAEQYGAALNDDGTFRVGGPANKGIPPGRYRVTVEKGSFGRPDEFGGAFGRDRSPLTVEVPAGKGVRVDVDLGKRSAEVAP